MAPWSSSEITVEALAADLPLAYALWERRMLLAEDLVDVADAAVRGGAGDVWWVFVDEGMPDVAYPFYELKEESERASWIDRQRPAREIDRDIMEAARRLLEVDTW